MLAYFQMHVLHQSALKLADLFFYLRLSQVLFSTGSVNKPAVAPKFPLWHPFKLSTLISFIYGTSTH